MRGKIYSLGDANQSTNVPSRVCGVGQGQVIRVVFCNAIGKIQVVSWSVVFDNCIVVRQGRSFGVAERSKKMHRTLYRDGGFPQGRGTFGHAPVTSQVFSGSFVVGQLWLPCFFGHGGWRIEQPFFDQRLGVPKGYRCFNCRVKSPQVYAGAPKRDDRFEFDACFGHTLETRGVARSFSFCQDLVQGHCFRLCDRLLFFHEYGSSSSS